MIQCTSQIKINVAAIKELNEVAVRALEKTAEALHTEIVQAQVMPFKTGNLQNESTFVDYSDSKNGKVSIVSSTPYARRLYFHPEYNFSHKENPNAKGKWFEDWENGGDKENFIPSVFAEFYRRELRQ
ncbi:MAG: hypothetical protein ACI4F9_00970 [Lachnospiraceae bacterium]